MCHDILHVTIHNVIHCTCTRTHTKRDNMQSKYIAFVLWVWLAASIPGPPSYFKYCTNKERAWNQNLRDWFIKYVYMYMNEGWSATIHYLWPSDECGLQCGGSSGGFRVSMEPLDLVIRTDYRLNGALHPWHKAHSQTHWKGDAV